MPITFRDFLTFPFNEGRGIRASQLEGKIDKNQIDSEFIKSVDNLLSGKLGFEWYLAIKNSQAFVPIDFIDESRINVKSEYPDMNLPIIPNDDYYFAAVAIPYTAREAALDYGGRVFGLNQLFDSGSIYRRQEIPIYLPNFNGTIPHRLFISRFGISPSTFLAASEWILSIRHRVSDYNRYWILSSDAQPDVSTYQNWNKSYTPLIELGDFEGGDKYLHLAVRQDIPPTSISIAAYGIANIFNSFRASGQFDDSDIDYQVYSSINRLDAATYSEKDLLILPERLDLAYYEAPTVLPDEALASNWYAGFYSWAKGDQQPENPVDAALINAGVGITESNSQQITMPDEGDAGGIYSPDDGENYVRFFVQPASFGAIAGIFSIPIITYASLSEIMTAAQLSWETHYTQQVNDVIINGVTHNVYLNRKNLDQWTSNAKGGETFLTFRS